MKNNRRDFLKKAGLAGAGLFIGCSGQAGNRETFQQPHNQQFNMHGYAAPELEKVRIGFIGTGSRGAGHVRSFARIEGVEVKALCDIVPKRVSDVSETIKEFKHTPDAYTSGEEAWKKLCDRDDIDLIIISTPWELHTPQAVYAMEQGKHVGVEVPAAKTIEECWELVETSERTRKHCMMLENVCYGDFELLTLNMARQGFFGEIIHGEGAYIHDRVSSNRYWVRDKDDNNSFGYNRWRLDENSERNGNLYPTHGLGPISQIMGLNYGDQMDYMVSISSNDFTMGNKMKEISAKDDYFESYVGNDFRGNINTSIIRTHRGRTIMLQHDISSPRPYSRIHLISGTGGMARKYPFARISNGHDWVSDEELKSMEEKYTPEIINRIGEMAKQVGGHGGMDMIMAWRMIDCLRNGLSLDQDVYDAALWSSIGPLSEWSVANRSNSIAVPDFTDGAWKTNKPNIDIELKNGGTTEFIV